MSKPIKIAIYSGQVPSTTFFERLVIGLASSGLYIYRFGLQKEKIKILHPGHLQIWNLNGMCLSRFVQKNGFKVIPFRSRPKFNDITEIKKKAKKIGASIITTEKDFIKLSYKEKKNINFLKVNLKIKNEKNFIDFLKLKIHGKY